MPAGWSVISCSVLSLRDSCFMYPSCQNCVSRLQKKQSDPRCWCPKCGFSWEVKHVNYRYRLSLNVKRNCDIFGVTVFGSCLNPYFGVPASCLQRLCDESKIKAGDSQDGYEHGLLIKAVQDSFIGRRFEFGIKLPPGHDIGRYSLSNECRFSAFQHEIVATRISLPNGAIGGSPVFSYFQKLLQSAQLADLSILQSLEGSSASPEHDGPNVLESFDCSVASFSGSPTQLSSGAYCIPGYWQQSPGIITSSAEQEEDTCSELDRTQVGSPWWCERSPKKHPRDGTHSPILAVQYHTSALQERETKCNERTPGYLGLLRHQESVEAPETSSKASFQGGVSLQPDTPEPTPLVSTLRTGNSPKQTKIMPVQLHQNETLDLKSVWGGALSTGKNDAATFQEGLSVCGWNSCLSESSAWEHLPLSESWGAFISKTKGFSVLSPKSNAHGAVVKEEVRMNGTGCEAETHSPGHSDQADGGSASKDSGAGLAKESTLNCYPAKDKGEVGMALSQRSFTTSPRVCGAESVSLYGNELNISRNQGLRAIALSSLDPHYLPLKFQKKVEGRTQLSVQRSRKLPAHRPSTQETLPVSGVWDSPLSECKEHSKDETKDYSDEAENQTAASCSNHSSSLHKQGILATASTGHGWDDQKSRFFCTEDTYNASADLFSGCEDSIDTSEEEDEKVTPQLEPRARVRSSGPLVDTYQRVHRKSREKKQNCSIDAYAPGSELYRGPDFAPFLQSTPIPRNPTPLCSLPRRGNGQTQNTLLLNSHLPAQHLLKRQSDKSKKQSENEKENVRGIDPECALLIGRSTHSYEQQGAIRSVQRHKPTDRYRCKRILLASGRRTPHRKAPSSTVTRDGNCQHTEENEKGNTVSSSVHVLPHPELAGQTECARSGSGLSRCTEVEISTVRRAVESCAQQSCSSPCNEHDVSVCNWSADLFAESFRN
ncbi:hypothetical protein JZ751_013950 [Albula glossodonta]|uniref:Replication factor A C-terminal domain-containing protein n=1 Tax=Albula glossodonta TaxID=121402 RepID=A0A8T2MXY5_9TELE|nr:hypothetical protein JZ751_013950 [Albula glossodonta]